jgi:type IV secretory pathway TraG/TraD family ATPase VirD4
MTLTTFVFIIFSNILLSSLSLVTINQLKGKIWIQSIVILFVYSVFTLFLGYIWEFSLYLFFFAYILPSVLLTAFILFSTRVLFKTKLKEFSFIYHYNNGRKLIIHDIFIGMLGLGGAGAGKTKSITKPTIQNLARLNFAGIIYDFKKFDLTKCAYTQYTKQRSTVSLKFVNFFDVRYSNLINPIDPKFLLNQAYAQQAATTLLTNLMPDVDFSKDPYFLQTASAGLAGMIWRLKVDYPTYCTIPHVVSIFTNVDHMRIARFISMNKDSRMTGASFIDAAASEKTISNVISTLNNALSKLAIPSVFYVLQDSEFSLKLTDKNEPTMLCISNEQSLAEVYSPIIATIISMSLKLMNGEGNWHGILLADEGMTLKIPNLDNTPATMREYKFGTIILTQDLTQVEGTYNRIGMDKIISNLGNQFYGRVRDPKTAKRYSEMFGKYEKIYTSRTRRSFETGSQTTSLREVEKFPPHLFTKLKAGEFYGVIGDGNKNEFHGRFDQYTDSEEMIPIIKPYITDRDIIQNKERIIDDSIQLILRDERFV